MSSYSRRPGANNYSQYLANLNAPPDAFAPQEALINDEELNLYINTEFNEAPDFGALSSVAAPSATESMNYDENNFDFTDFSFLEPSSFTAPQAPFTFPTTSPPQIPQTQTQTQPQIPQPQQPTPSSAHKPSISASVSAPTPTESLSATQAAEEDKRRRNTAASARFRVKKKQREQALEKSAKEMSNKVEVMESRIKELEMQNRWLKSLVVEKTGRAEGEVEREWNERELKAEN